VRPRVFIWGGSRRSPAATNFNDWMLTSPFYIDGIGRRRSVDRLFSKRDREELSNRVRIKYSAQIRGTFIIQQKR